SNSFDRYTFYRLLSQLGTDSAEEPEHADLIGLIAQISAQNQDEFLADTIGRVNLNYDNINNVARNFVDWEPLTFFTNVGHILFLSQSNSLWRQIGITNFGITNIPVYPTNLYLPFVHRLLQVAANIYDATTNDPLPSVFLPIVKTNKNANGVVSARVAGYTNNLNRVTALQWAATNEYGLP